MVSKGIEIGLHLSRDLKDEAFVAEALGCLACFKLSKERGEELQWQIFRVTGGSEHHFRLVVRHPSKLIDISLRKKLEDSMEELSSLSEPQLADAFNSAVREGMKTPPLREVKEDLDIWNDSFWNWFG
ncbi:MAG: hypothetical protein QXP70_05330 [Methanomassiliicoccales archaeon]